MKRKKLIILLILFIAIFACIIIYKVFLKPSITVGTGFESAYIIWKNNDVLDYNVYIKNVDDALYKKLDKELVRNVQNGIWRADAVGLKEGSYNFKIVPLIGQDEVEEDSIVSDTINVEANIREGFSFSKNSTNYGDFSGGYLQDGEALDDARVIYITKENVNDITLKIEDSEGNMKMAHGICEILKNWNNEPLIIRIIGKIEREDIEGLEEKNKAILIDGLENVTIEGIGNNATLKGIGLILENSSNIEIRNLGFMLFHEDAICLEKNNHSIWIHNNDFFYGENRESEETDKGKGDGAIDIKESEYITISYNHFWDNGKTSLCGIDKDVNYITYHHNWFDHSDTRCPRVYYASSHVYNNYYDSNASYGIAAVEGASVFAESNYFKGCKRPMIIPGQGSAAVYELLDENLQGGMIKSYGNIVKGEKRLIYSSEDSKEFDAYIAKSREETVPSSYKTVKGDYTYNNFDTDTNIMYSYNADNAKDVKKIVTKNAGRLQGSDISLYTWLLSRNSYKRTTFIEKRLDKLIEKY